MNINRMVNEEAFNKKYEVLALASNQESIEEAYKILKTVEYIDFIGVAQVVQVLLITQTY